MGKIIEFPGSPDRTDRNDPDKISSERIRIDFEKLKFFLNTVADLVKRLPAGHNKKLSLQENLVVVGAYTDSELKGWVENSNVSQWIQKPLFFAAIALEVKKRKLI